MILPLIIASLPVIEAATNAVAERLILSNPTNGLCRFVHYEANARHDEFVFNTNFWLRGVDFSCVSPWNNRGGRFRAGTAISKRHIVFAAHLPLLKGDRLVFVGEDGGVCPNRVSGTKRIGTTDIMIGSLDYELTPNIVPAKILPLDCEKYIGNGNDLPLVTFNQFEEAFLTDLAPFVTSSLPYTAKSQFVRPGPRAAYRRPIVGGDSGDPAFTLIGDQPILLYCLFCGGAGSGPALHYYRREIQAAMDELCPGYTLEVFDFGKAITSKN